MVIITPLMALTVLLPMHSPHPLALVEMLILTRMRTSLSVQTQVSLLFMYTMMDHADYCQF